MTESAESAYILTVASPLTCEMNINSFFTSLFDIKKLVCIKSDDPAKKGEINRVVLILNTGNNSEMLNDVIVICETQLTPRSVNLAEAEQAIKNNKTKLYVGNLTYGIDNCKLWKHFSNFGQIDYTYLIRQPTKKVKGFGFIVFEKKSSFDVALKQKHYIDGQRLICKHFLNKSNTRKQIEFETAKDESHQQHEKTVALALDEDDDKIVNQKGSHSTGSSKEPITCKEKINTIKAKASQRENKKVGQSARNGLCSKKSKTNQVQPDTIEYMSPVQADPSPYYESFNSYENNLYSAENSYQENSWHLNGYGYYENNPKVPDNISSNLYGSNSSGLTYSQAYDKQAPESFRWNPYMSRDAPAQDRGNNKSHTRTKLCSTSSRYQHDSQECLSFSAEFASSQDRNTFYHSLGHEYPVQGGHQNDFYPH